MILPLFLLLTGGNRDAEPLIRAMDWDAKKKGNKDDMTFTVVFFLVLALIAVFVAVALFA